MSKLNLAFVIFFSFAFVVKMLSGYVFVRFSQPSPFECAVINCYDEI